MKIKYPKPNMIKLPTFMIKGRYEVYRHKLILTIESLDKIKKILFLRNIKHTTIYDHHYYYNYIDIGLTEDYNEELLNKDLGGSVEGYIYGG